MQFNMRILSLLFLLLGLSPSCYSETCPEESKLHSCSCEIDDEDVMISCGSKEQTVEKLKETFSSLIGKKNVHIGLGDIDLGSLPSTLFNGVLVKGLYMTDCKLESLTDDPDQPALLGLEDTLEVINIAGSLTKNVGPSNVKLGHMRKLKEIELTRNPITELSNDWYEKGPTSLEELWITWNGIEDIGDRAFANLVNLKKLYLVSNRFGSIRRSMFPNPAERLETLELDNNALTTIPEDLFTNMPALTGVSLLDNGILRLDQTTWQTIWQQLTYASFKGNPLECDSNIDWIFSLKKHPRVNGRCNTPRDLENMDLQDLIESKTRE